MAKIFSFASWNVEQFANDPDRIEENVQFIKHSNPDVFAIFEVVGKDVFSHFIKLMDTHNFFITEDFSSMETLVGVNRRLTAFVTQRQKFKSEIPTLRPGALVTLTIDNDYYSILFLHMKSMDDPRSWGLRDDMIGHVINLKKALDSNIDDPDLDANFICMGDLNTMGMNLTYSDKDMDGSDELERYVKRLKRQNIKLLKKDFPNTWWNGIGSTDPPSDLDHVFASDTPKFTKLCQTTIAVKGWPEKNTPAKQTEWIKKHSDHAMLYGEVCT